MNPDPYDLLDEIYTDADTALVAHLDRFDASTRTASPPERDALLRSTTASLMRSLSALSARAGVIRAHALASELRAWAWAELTARFSAPAHVELIERALSVDHIFGAPWATPVSTPPVGRMPCVRG